MCALRRCIGTVLFAMLGCGAASAESPLTLLVPWPAGGAVDAAARSLQPELAREAARPVVVENLAGAGGLIALDRYARRSPAERGVLVGSASDLITGLLTNAGSSKLKPEDFRLIGMVVAGSLVLMASEKLPARDFDELVAYARTQPPQTLKFAHAGQGSVLHLAWEELCARAGISALQVPYRGAPDMLRDLANGQLDIAFVPLNTSTLGYPGVRALGMTAATRHPLFAQVPTLAEGQAAHGYEYIGWIALAVLRDTPTAELARLEGWAQAAARAPAFIEGVRSAGGLPPPMLTRAQLDQFYDAEVTRHRTLIRRLRLGSVP